GHPPTGEPRGVARACNSPDDVLASSRFWRGKAGMRIGIDVGGTKMEVLALDQNGTEMARKRVSTPKGDYNATVSAVVDLVGYCEQATGRSGSVGLGIPGSPNPRTGLIRNANSTWLNGR